MPDPGSGTAPPFRRLPAPSGRAPAFLDGVRVLDLTTSIAGPYATLLLGDLGADVVKVERPGAGDDTRAWGPPFLDGQSLWFLSVNRNKRSLALDMRGAAGRALLHDLARTADIVVTNQVPRVQAKLGTDHETLRALNPALVFVSITGFGLTGERRDWACYDLIAEGRSGVMDMTGDRDGPPQKVGTPAADLLSGMDAALAAVAAYVDRLRTGNGHLVDIAMVESMTRFMTPWLVSYLGSGEVPRRSGGTESVIAVYQTFHTADAPMTLGLGNDALWKRFWAAVGRPERGESADHASNADRRADRPAIVAEIQAVLATRPRAEWLALFGDCGVPAGPINRLDEVAADPDLLARGLVYRMRGPFGDIPQVGLGIGFDGQASAPRRAPPALGADAATVMADWLGRDAAAVAALAESGAIVVPDRAHTAERGATE